MRERAKALVGARAAKDLAISTFHSLGVRMLRSDGEKLGLKPQFSILDSDDVLGVLRDAGGCSDNALARRWQWAISLWKNQGLDSAGAAGAAAQRRRARGRARDAGLRAAPGGLPGGGLRRPDRPAAEAAAARRRGARQMAGAVPPRAGRRSPGHQRGAVRAAEGAGRAPGRAPPRPVHRGRRRRPEHLRLARRDHRQPAAPAAGLSQAEG